MFYFLIQTKPIPKLFNALLNMSKADQAPTLKKIHYPRSRMIKLYREIQYYLSNVETDRLIDPLICLSGQVFKSVFLSVKAQKGPNYRIKKCR